jgi:hypothetical protein
MTRGAECGDVEQVLVLDVGSETTRSVRPPFPERSTLYWSGPCFQLRLYKRA